MRTIKKWTAATNLTSHPPKLILSLSKDRHSYRWIVLAILCVAQTMAALVAVAVAPLAPFLQSEFHISRAEVGLLISALYVGATLSSMPSGWLTDVLGSRVMLLASQGIIGAASLLLSRADSFVQALAVMPLIGLGYGGINPMSTKVVMLRFPGRIRGTAMSIKQTGFALGGSLGALILPGLALALGWRAALVGASAVITAYALVSGWLFREAPAEAPAADGRAAATPGLRSTYGKLVRNRDLMVLVAIGVIFSAIQLIVTGYLLLFLAEVVHLPLVAAGAMLSLAQLSGAAGRILWGAASDHVTRGRRRPVLFVIGVITAVAAVLVGQLGVGAPGWAVAGGVALLGATAIGWNGVYATLVGELARGDSVAGAAALAMTANFVGVILGPPLFGLVVDLTESYALAWRLVAVLGLLNLFGLLLVRERSGQP